MLIRKRVFIAAACLATAFLLLMFLTRPRQPQYAGHSLSYWVEKYGLHLRAGWPMSPDLTNALSQIGTNAIPFLVNWITYSPKPSPVRDRAITFLTQPTIPQMIRPSANRSVQLLQDDVPNHCEPAFSFLGANALPPLLHLLDQQPSLTNDIAVRVQGALSCYHTDEAVPFYLHYITNTNANYRPFVIHLLALCPLATNAAPALNTIIDCLTNRDAELVGAAKGALHMPPNFGAESIYVPFLTNRLAASQDQVLRSNIVEVLGEMGLRWTLSPVVTALEDSDLRVRMAATNAIQQWIRLVVSPSLRADLSRYLSPPVK